MKYNKLSSKVIVLIIMFLLPLLISGDLFGQNNSLVLNGSFIVLNGGDTDESIYLVVNQNNSSGIIRQSGGHVISENQYNYIKWVTENETGSYIFPFGADSSSSNYIPFTFNKTSGNTSVSLSTWATDQGNMPHPGQSNVAAVSNMTGNTDSVVYAIDRFWDIISSDAVTADLTFSYLGQENTTDSPNENIKAQHWNGTSWDAAAGTGNPGVTSGIGTVGPVLNQSAFSPWVLTVVIDPCLSVNVDLGNDTMLCEGETLVLDAGSGYIYQWNDNSTNQFLTADQSDTYSVTISDGGACTDSDTIEVTFVENYLIEKDISICEGDSIYLGGEYQTDEGDYYDTIPSSVGCDTIVTTTLSVIPPQFVQANEIICQGDSIFLEGAWQTTAGVYHDTLPTWLGCDSIVETTVTIDQGLPVDVQIGVSPSSTVCQGESLYCFATITNGGSDPAIEWYLNSTQVSSDSSFTLSSFNSNDSVYCTVTSNCSMNSTTSEAIYLTINPNPVIVLSNDTIICPGEDYELAVTGGDSYLWNNNETSSQITVTPEQITTYTVTVTNSYNCSDSGSVTIDIYTSVPYAVSDTLYLAASESSVTHNLAQNDSGTIITYSVVTDPLLGQVTLSQQGIAVYTYASNTAIQDSLVYKICDATCCDEAWVYINIEGGTDLFIPNAITPDGDGKNDYFTILGLESYPENSLVIFNRWGNILFEASPYHNDWEGKGKSGEPLPNGAYYYLIQLDNENTYTGYIEVIR